MCNLLGDRLSMDPAAATLCYMCAANIERTTALWEAHHTPADGTSETAALLDMMEKLSVFQVCTCRYIDTYIHPTWRSCRSCRWAHAHRTRFHHEAYLSRHTLPEPSHVT
mgnify:CR=1 FL=1